MNLPTTKPNQYDLAWYIRECAALQRENAALREDKARLDHLLRELSGPRPFWQWHNWTREQMIVAIDAARKEAQP